jgi:hypothetical protein
MGTGQPVLARYERVTFHKELINVLGKPIAAFVCPGHPLLSATIDLMLERYRDLLKRGTVLVDTREDAGENIRALFYLEHAIQDARVEKDGGRRIVSREMQFVELDETGQARMAGYAPYLDYRPITEEERGTIERQLGAAWLKGDLESKALSYAIEHLVPGHFEGVRKFKEQLVIKTVAAVKDRLTKEINYWDHRAEQLKLGEESGKTNARINSAKARDRANELEARLKKRMEELEQERHLSALPPVVTGGAIVVPERLLDHVGGEGGRQGYPTSAERARIDKLAVAVVMAREREIGRTPREMRHDNPGYDIESTAPEDGDLYFIEVKGVSAGKGIITVSKTQILTALNKPDHWFLAVVEVDGNAAKKPVYITRPFQREPDFAVTSVNYNLEELLARASQPS